MVMATATAREKRCGMGYGEDGKGLDRLRILRLGILFLFF